MEHRFQTSRLTRGNTVFPTVLVVSDRYVTRIKPSLAGRVEESISLRQVSSVTVSQGAIFADVVVHSAGGTDPLRSHGHTNGEAIRLKQIIEEFQTNILTAGVADVSHLRPCPRCAETIKVAAQVCRHCGSEVRSSSPRSFRRSRNPRPRGQASRRRAAGRRQRLDLELTMADEFAPAQRFIDLARDRSRRERRDSGTLDAGCVRISLTRGSIAGS